MNSKERFRQDVLNFTPKNQFNKSNVDTSYIDSLLYSKKDLLIDSEPKTKKQTDLIYKPPVQENFFDVGFGESEIRVPAQVNPSYSTKPRNYKQNTADYIASSELSNNLYKIDVMGQRAEYEKALKEDSESFGADTILTDVFDFLSVGNYTTASAIEVLLNDGSPEQALKQAAVEFSNSLGFADNLGLESQVRRTTWGDIFTGKRGKTALTIEDSPYIAGAAGFLFDIFLDPTTYTGYGLLKVAKGVGKLDNIAGAAVGANSVSTIVSSSGIGKEFRKMFIPNSLVKGLKDGENVDEIVETVNSLRLAEDENATLVTAEEIQGSAADFLGGLIRKDAAIAAETDALRENILKVASDLNEGELRLIGAYLDQPNLNESIIDQLKVNDNTKSVLKTASQEFRDMLRLMGEAESKVGLFDEAQLRANYSKGMEPISEFSRAIVQKFFQLRFGKELGLKKYQTHTSGPVTYSDTGIMKSSYAKSYPTLESRIFDLVSTETNVALMTVSRGMESIRKVNSQKFFDAVLSDTRIAVPIDAKVATDANDPLRTSLESHGMKVFKAPTLSTRKKALQESGEEQMYYALPAAMVDQLDEMNKVFTNPNDTNKFLRTFKEVQGIWKSYALLSPGYHARNLYSNVFNNYIAGVDDPLVYNEALLLQVEDTANIKNRAVRSASEALLGGRKTLDTYMFDLPDGTKVSARTIKEELTRNGIDQGGMIYAETDLGIGKELMTSFELRSSRPKTTEINDGMSNWGNREERIARVATQIYQSSLGGAKVKDVKNLPQGSVRVAELYDLVARSWAWKNAKTPEDWYDRHIHDFRAFALADEENPQGLDILFSKKQDLDIKKASTDYTDTDFDHANYTYDSDYSLKNMRFPVITTGSPKIDTPEFKAFADETTAKDAKTGMPVLVTHGTKTVEDIVQRGSFDTGMLQPHANMYGQGIYVNEDVFIKIGETQADTKAIVNYNGDVKSEGFNIVSNGYATIHNTSENLDFIVDFERLKLKTKKYLNLELDSDLSKLDDNLNKLQKARQKEAATFTKAAQELSRILDPQNADVVGRKLPKSMSVELSKPVSQSRFSAQAFGDEPKQTVTKKLTEQENNFFKKVYDYLQENVSDYGDSFEDAKSMFLPKSLQFNAENKTLSLDLPTRSEKGSLDLEVIRFEEFFTDYESLNPALKERVSEFSDAFDVIPKSLTRTSEQKTFGESRSFTQDFLTAQERSPYARYELDKDAGNRIYQELMDLLLRGKVRQKAYEDSTMFHKTDIEKLIKTHTSTASIFENQKKVKQLSKVLNESSKRFKDFSSYNDIERKAIRTFAEANQMNVVDPITGMSKARDASPGSLEGYIMVKNPFVISTRNANGSSFTQAQMPNPKMLQMSDSIAKMAINDLAKMQRTPSYEKGLSPYTRQSLGVKETIPLLGKSEIVPKELPSTYEEPMRALSNKQLKELMNSEEYKAIKRGVFTEMEYADIDQRLSFKQKVIPATREKEIIKESANIGSGNTYNDDFYQTMSVRLTNLYNKAADIVNREKLVEGGKVLEQRFDVGMQGYNLVNYFLKDLGFDAITHADGFKPYRPTSTSRTLNDEPFNVYSQTWVLFDSSQFKSTKNRGTWNTGDQNMFKQQVDDKIKGAIQFLPTGKANILATPDADTSTFVHELGHLIRRTMLSPSDKKVVQRFVMGNKEYNAAYKKAVKKAEKAAMDSPQANIDVDELVVSLMEKEMGVEKYEEIFAKSFEQYVMEGVEFKTMPSVVRGTFDYMKESMQDIYDFSEGGKVGIKPKDETRYAIERALGRGTETDPETLATPRAILESATEVSGESLARKAQRFLGSNALVKYNRAMGERLENNARIAHYLHMRKNDVGELKSNGLLNKKAVGRGMTEEEAAESVRRYLFDYNELTPFERDVMKTIIPFYTWMRKNIPLQLQSLVERPQRYSPVAKFQNNLEVMSSEEYDPSTPDYYETMNAVRLPFDSGSIPLDGDGMPTYLALDLPYTDLNRLNMKDMISSMSPYLKLFSEIYPDEGLSFYLNSPIEAYKGEPSYLDVYNKKIDTGLTEKQMHVLTNLAPPVGKVARLVTRAGEGKLGEQLLREVFGLNVRALDVDAAARAKLYQRRNVSRAVLKRLEDKAKLIGLGQATDEIIDDFINSEDQ